MGIKLLSWNIWVLGDFDKIREFIKNSNADIIALQEVQNDKPELDVINFLNELGYEHVASTIKGFWDNTEWSYGPAVFSKYKIISSKIHKLSNIKDHLAIQVEVKVGDKVLHLFNTHLLHTNQQQSDIQDEQVLNLIKLLPDRNTILLGDFNSLPDSTVIKAVRKVLVQADDGLKPTAFVYPTKCCNINSVEIRLDYIFASSDLKLRDFTVGNSRASDHLPIYATLVI